MNYFAHARLFLDEPYFVAGTAVPDWLNVVDRRVRARSKSAVNYVDHTDERIAAVASGIIQHHFDDAWFHQSEAFNRLSLAFSVDIRQLLPGDEGFRPSFLGHILVEILLDAILIREEPERLDEYHDTLNRVDPEIVQEAVNLIAIESTDQLAAMIPRFNTERFLYDYQDDVSLLKRLNHVMYRVKLPVLPQSILEFLPVARERVRENRDLLLDDPLQIRGIKENTK